MFVHTAHCELLGIVHWFQRLPNTLLSCHVIQYCSFTISCPDCIIYIAGCTMHDDSQLWRHLRLLTKVDTWQL